MAAIICWLILTCLTSLTPALAGESSVYIDKTATFGRIKRVGMVTLEDSQANSVILAMVRQELYKHGKYTTVNLADKKLYKYNELITLGNEVGLDGILMLAVADYGYRGKKNLPVVEFSLRLVSVPQGETVWSLAGRSPDPAQRRLEDAAKDTVSGAVSELIAKLIGLGDTSAYGIVPAPIRAVPGFSRMRLFWPATGHHYGREYVVLRSNLPDGGGGEIHRAPVTEPGTELFFEDKEVSPDKDYYYTYYITTSSELKSPPAEPVKVALKIRPDTPTGVKAVSGLGKEVKLTWNPLDDPEVDGYRIYRSSPSQLDSSPEGMYKLIATVKDYKASVYADKGSWFDSLNSQLTYYYKISAYYDSVHESYLSEAISASTGYAPVAPVNLQAQSGLVRKVHLTWEPGPVNDISAYAIYRCDSMGGKFERIEVVKGRENTLFTDEKLEDGRKYLYRVTAISSRNTASDFSAPATAVTKGKPDRPIGLKAATNQARRVTLTWNINSEPDILAYHILRKDKGGYNFGRVGSAPAALEGMQTYTDTGLEDGAAYVYKIQAENNGRLLSEPSAEVFAITKSRPPKPSKITVTLIQGGIRLKWEGASPDNVAGYRVYRKSWHLLANKFNKLAEVTHSWYVDPDLTSGRTYEYKISAFDADNLESQLSETVSITIP